MNIDDVGTQLLFSVSPIFYQSSADVVHATGFYYSHNLEGGGSVPFFLTGYHALKDLDNGFFAVHIQKDGKPTPDVIQIHFDSETVNERKLDGIDLVAFPIAPIFDMFEKKSIVPFYRSIDSGLVPSREIVDSLSAIEETTCIGYQDTQYDKLNKTPFTRRGITASPIWNDYNGDNHFLIDVHASRGMSGSPVFILNQGSYSTNEGITVGSRLLFVGMVVESPESEFVGTEPFTTVLRSDAIQAAVGRYVTYLLGQ